VAAGRRSLREHLVAQAAVARHKHGPLTRDTLEAFLDDRDCVRYPTRLVFEFGEMAPHQFAQPDRDPRDADGAGRVLYLRPELRGQPERTVPAVAYMIPVINYGGVVSDDDCVAYGAALLGLEDGEYYRQICALADALGAEPRVSDLGRGDSARSG
jgi:hypothetical protein